MVDCDSPARRRRREEHPSWCVQQSWDIGHRSEEYEITPDEFAGVGMTLALHGRVGAEFIQIMIWPYDGEPPHPVLVCDLSGACCEDEPLPSGDIDSSGSGPVRQHPDDPIYITDPHAHDMTLAQAGEVYRALGELLALAHSESEPSARPRRPSVVKGTATVPIK